MDTNYGYILATVVVHYGYKLWLHSISYGTLWLQIVAKLWLLLWNIMATNCGYTLATGVMHYGSKLWLQSVY